MAQEKEAREIEFHKKQPSMENWLEAVVAIETAFDTALLDAMNRSQLGTPGRVRAEGGRLAKDPTSINARAQSSFPVETGAPSHADIGRTPRTEADDSHASEQGSLPPAETMLTTPTEVHSFGLTGAARHSSTEHESQPLSTARLKTRSPTRSTPPADSELPLVMVAEPPSSTLHGSTPHQDSNPLVNMTDDEILDFLLGDVKQELFRTTTGNQTKASRICFCTTP